VNNELATLWNKTVVSHFDVHPGICIEGLRKVTKTSELYVSRSRFKSETYRNKSEALLILLEPGCYLNLHRSIRKGHM
jgi:hypothetical protein